MNATLDKIEHDITLSEWAAAIASELQLKGGGVLYKKVAGQNKLGHFELFWTLPAELAVEVTKWEEQEQIEWDGEWPLMVIAIVDELVKQINKTHNWPTDTASIIKKAHKWFTERG